MFGIRVRFTGLFLLATLFSFAESCGHSTPQQARPTDRPEATKASAATPAPSKEKINQDVLLLLKHQTEPIALVDIQYSKPHASFRGELVIQFQNVSDKPIKFVAYNIDPPLLCPRFMYAIMADSVLGYGDWSVIPQASLILSPKPQINSPVLNPQLKASITASSKDLDHTLDPKTYASCPSEKKPRLVLSHVYFVDGTEWDSEQSPLLWDPR